MTTAQLMRLRVAEMRDQLVTERATGAVRVRRASLGPFRAAARDFGTWARSGATPRQCVRQAVNTFRAFV